MGKKTAARHKALSMEELSKAEEHAKRLDARSQKRVNKERAGLSPISTTSLDYRELFDKFTENCKMNKSLKKPVQHFIFQFPTDIPVNDKNHHEMLKIAQAFCKQIYGDDSVMSARIDRDEDGQHVVDVFVVERYEKRLKDGSASTWVSNSRAGKILCEKHREEILRRLPQFEKRKGEDGDEEMVLKRDKHGEPLLSTSPSAFGMALNSEWNNYLRQRIPQLARKQERKGFRHDNLSVEGYKLKREMEKNTQLHKVAKFSLDKLHELARYLTPNDATILQRFSKSLGNEIDFETARVSHIEQYEQEIDLEKSSEGKISPF